MLIPYRSCAFLVWDPPEPDAELGRAAAEKSLKVVPPSRGIAFPFKHDLAHLIFPDWRRLLKRVRVLWPGLTSARARGAKAGTKECSPGCRRPEPCAPGYMGDFGPDLCMIFRCPEKRKEAFRGKGNPNLLYKPIPGTTIEPTMEDEVNHLVQQITYLVHPKRILLFGSRATGRQTAKSDIDLLLVMPSGTNRRSVAQHLYQHIRGIRTPFDLVVTTEEQLNAQASNTGLIYHSALAEGIVVYAA